MRDFQVELLDGFACVGAPAPTRAGPAAATGAVPKLRDFPIALNRRTVTIPVVPDSTNPAPRRILVIDDDPDICLLLKRVLTRRGYEVLLTANGRLGIELLAKEPFDLLITDVLMPDADGFEILRAVQKRCPDLPVMVISGGAEFDAEYYLQIAKSMRAVRTLRKPFGHEDICNAVAELLPPTPPAN